MRPRVKKIAKNGSKLFGLVREVACLSLEEGEKVGPSKNWDLIVFVREDKKRASQNRLLSRALKV